MTWFLLVFGATVRVHGAGLACPDWPLCFGEVIPELNFQVFLEWGHRTFAGAISLGFLGLGGWILWRPRLRAQAGWLVLASAFVLVVQIVLGGLTVLHLLAYWSVTLHLLTGNVFLLSLLVIAERLAPPVANRAAGAPIAQRHARVLAALVVVAWFVQMALGGLVSSNFAGLACTEWPTCNAGVWFPTFDGIVGLQLLHRAGAYALFALAVGFAWVARGHAVAGLAKALLGLVLFQVLLGITNVIMELPVEVAVLHSAVADLIGIVAVIAALRVRAPALLRAHGAPAVALA